MIKKRWSKPKLVVLTEGKTKDKAPREAVLGICKNNVSYGLPFSAYTRCGQWLTQCWYSACGACSTLSLS